MHIEWRVTEADKDLVSTLVDEHRHTLLNRDRRTQNLAENKGSSHERAALESNGAMMATVIANVTDYRAFWLEIVLPDYNDFNAKIDDLRRAFHCAISLFHMSDWVYHAHKAYIDANFTFCDRNGVVRRVSDEMTFANALGQLHPDFDLIHGIANSAKHLALKNPRPHPAAPSHAANTYVRAIGSYFGTSYFGPRYFGRYFGQMARVVLEGPGGQDREFAALAKSALKMWKQLSQQHKWQLT